MLNTGVFAKHAGRVKMADIAQMINVLQAMILTRDEKMLLTPTHHVFEMYKPFQDAASIPIDIQSPWYRAESSNMQSVQASAVKDKDGRLHIGLVNVDPNHPVTLTAKLDGASASSVKGRILTANAINAHNTFEQPNEVRPAAFTGAALDAGTLKVTLPSKSIVMLDLQ